MCISSIAVITMTKSIQIIIDNMGFCAYSWFTEDLIVQYQPFNANLEIKDEQKNY